MSASAKVSQIIADHKDFYWLLLFPHKAPNVFFFFFLVSVFVTPEGFTTLVANKGLKKERTY